MKRHFHTCVLRINQILMVLYFKGLFTRAKNETNFNGSKVQRHFHTCVLNIKQILMVLKVKGVVNIINTVFAQPGHNGRVDVL